MSAAVRWWVPALLIAAGCEGGGSDIGPRLDRLPDASFKVAVLDDAGRGVSGAMVTVGAAAAAAATPASGRTDLFAQLSGRLLVEVDAAAASATDADRLASLRFRAQTPGPHLPFAVHLPDTSTSAVLELPAGTTAAAATLDDSAGSGARLLVAAGTAVTAAGRPTAALRLGVLQPHHLPGELPLAASGANLWTRGYFVDPPDLELQPGADLDVPDELALPVGATAQLHWLEPVSGEWVPVGVAVPGGGRLVVSGGVTRGGLYAIATPVAGLTTVSGRVLDAAEGRAVDGALVAVGAGRAVADGSGRFTVSGLPATLADGSARSVAVEVRGGPLWLPTATATTAALVAGGAQDLGDLSLDTEYASLVRFQLVTRGRAEARRRFPLSNTEWLAAQVAFADDQGQCWFDDVPAGFVGFLTGIPAPDRDDRVLVAEGIGSVPDRRRNVDFNGFYDERFLREGGDSTRVLVVDDVGGGPVEQAIVAQGSTDGQGFVGRTLEGGTVFADRGFQGRATVALETALDGGTLRSAFSIERPNARQLELPLSRLLRPPLGAFDRHGLAVGRLTGFDPAAEQRVVATRVLELGEWFGAVMQGVALVSAVPVKFDPGQPQGSYRAGVALPLGNLAVAEGSPGAAFTLTKLGVADALQVPEGRVTELDLPLQHPANTTFTAAGALVDLDPSLPQAALRFDLGLQRPDGLVVDVVREVAGNITPAGDDAALLLPALAGELAGYRWLVALGAEAATATTTTRQRVFVALDAAAAAPPTPQLPLPQITAPADGATVPADDLVVELALPADADYGVLELESAGSDALCWRVVVPPDTTGFRFHELPSEAASPLLPGRTYTLTVSAARIDVGPFAASSDPYPEFTGFWFSIDAGERGVRALSTRAITITTN